MSIPARGIPAKGIPKGNDRQPVEAPKKTVKAPKKAAPKE